MSDRFAAVHARVDAFGARGKMKSSIPIILDTTVYKQIPKLDTELFLELIRYCRMGRFKLYIPEVVEKEYLTWIHKEAQDAFNSVAKASESLNKFYQPPELLGFSMRFNITTDIVRSHIDGVLEKVNSNWERFKRETTAIVLPIEEHHGKQVMDAYFQGSKPFKSLKNRTDIPDAFIYFSLLDILQENKEVLFLSQDQNFVGRISDPRILVFGKLSDVFSKTEYKVSESFFSNLKEDDRAYHLFQYFKEEIVHKSKKQIDRSNLLSDIENDFTNDVIGEYRETYSEVEDIVFDHGATRVISNYSYLVPFVADIEITVSSLASYQDIARVEAVRKSRLADREVNDDGRYDIKEIYHSKVKGNLSMRFSESDPLLWKVQEKDHGFFKETDIPEIVVMLEDIERCT